MAMPYPEGEVFFSRSALRTTGGFDPSAFDAFRSHILVEYVYNHPNDNQNDRAYRQWVLGSRGERFYFPSSINFMFAKAPKEEPIRLLKVGPCSNSTDYEIKKKGGIDKVLIRPIKIKADERFMYMDLEVPLRAIYLPLAHKIDTKHPDLCSYLMIDLRYRKGAYMQGNGGSRASSRTVSGDSLSEVSGDHDDDILPGSGHLGAPHSNDTLSAHDHIDSDRGSGNGKRQGAPVQMNQPSSIFRDNQQYTWQKFDDKEGLGVREDRTLRVDLLGAANYLVVPRQMREPTKDLFSPSKAGDALVIFDWLSTQYVTKWTVESQAFESKIEYIDVIKDHYGVDVVYQPVEFEALAKSLVQQIASALAGALFSLVPVAGPLASVAWLYFVEAIYNPERFRTRNNLELDEGTLIAVIASAATIAQNVLGAKSGGAAFGGSIGGG